MSLVIGIRYLTGYSVATDCSSRARAEWPPHPGRVYMALVAAHFETAGSDADSRRPERAALSWLEQQGNPQVYAPAEDRRTVLEHYVPPNDFETARSDPQKLKPAAIRRSLNVIPDFRFDRQARTFPRVRPHEDRVYLIWDRNCPEDHRKALESLCHKVTRIGHSSSLVQMWIADSRDVPPPNWVPDDIGATIQLRSVSPGLLTYLEDQFGEAARQEYETLAAEIARLESEKKAVAGRSSRQRKVDLQMQIDELSKRLPTQPPRPPLRPIIGTWQGYRRPDQKVNGELPGTVWDPRLVVFRLEPEKTSYPRLDLATTLQLTQRMHEAVVKAAHAVFCGCDKWNGPRSPAREDEPACWERIPTFVTGHDPHGSPTDQPHLAYFPLAFVGREYADGHLMGLAVALPDRLDSNSRRKALSVLMAVNELKLGRLGVWRLNVEDRELPPFNVRPDTWTAAESGATQWSTVTPIAFDKHSKAKGRVEYHQEVVEMIRRGWKRIACAGGDAPSIPEPQEIVVTPVSAHLGVPAAHEFPRMRRKDGSERRHVHAILVFDRPIRGPMAVCAGRYRGYGLLRPIHAAGLW